MILPMVLSDDERGRALVAARLAVLEAAKPLRRYVERMRRAGVAVHSLTPTTRCWPTTTGPSASSTT